jgi:MFS family permease
LEGHYADLVEMAGTSPAMTMQAADANSIFNNRSFVLFWLSRVCASVAVQMQALAVGWQIYNLTDSPFDLGLVGLMQFLPLVSLMLVAGQVADRYDRTLIVQVSLAITGTSVAVLAIGTASGWINRDVILVTILVFGSARAFQTPTTAALLPALVPAPLLSRAVAASSSTSQIAVIAGPAIGGMLYAVSPPLVYALSAVLFLAASLLLWPIRLVREPPRRAPVTFELVFAGIVYIWRSPVVLGAISLDLFAVLLGGATALLPIFARDIFGTGPVGLGFLQMSPALGALAMSIPLARWPMRGRVGPTLFATVACFGGATILFGLSRSFALTMVALAAYGAADMVSVVIRDTLIQVGTPDAMRGRVSAVHSLFIGTSNQLGQFRAGLTADWFGAVAAVVIGGVATLAVVIGGLKAFPELAGIKSIEDLAAPSSQPD